MKSFGSIITLAFLAAVFPSEGKVEVLRTDTFDVATREGFWLVEFYAPWCGHCKRLNPILDEISEESAEKGMKIGKVDATVEKKLQDAFEVEGFPTLKFRVRPGDKWRTFEGIRKGVNILEFADRMLSDPLPVIKNEDDLNTLVQQSNETGNGIVFLFGQDDNSETWKNTAASIAKGVQHKTYCGMLAADASFSWPGMQSNGEVVENSFPKGKFLASIEKGEMSRFAPSKLLEGDVDSNSQAEEWILSNNFPVYSELSSSNFRKLGKLGKLLVIAIVDPANETTANYLEGFQTVARSILAEKNTFLKPSADKEVKSDVPLSIADQYVFGSLDGVHWAEFIEQFNIFGNELPRLVVLDSPKEVFFEDASVDESDEMDTFLHQVFEGKIPAQKEGLRGTVNRFFAKIQSMGWRFYLLAIPFVIAIVGSFIIPTTPPNPRNRDRKND